MKQLFIKASLITCLLLVVALEACSGSRPATSGGSPAVASSSPVPVFLSSDVVRISSSPVQIKRNGSADAVLTLSISPGFHINANPATFPYLIPTRVEQVREAVGHITMGKPVYPPAAIKKFAFSEHPLAVYEGDIPIRLPLRVESNALADQQPLFIKVQVQACDNEKCYPPTIVDTAITVDVK